MLKDDIQDNMIYLKTYTLRNKDISEIKNDIKKQMILIIRITPLAQRDVDDLRIVIEDSV